MSESTNTALKCILKQFVSYSTADVSYRFFFIELFTIFLPIRTKNLNCLFYLYNFLMSNFVLVKALFYSYT